MSELKKTSLEEWPAWVLTSIMGVIGGLGVGGILGAIVGTLIVWPLGEIITAVGVSILSIVIAGIGAIAGAVVGLKLAWSLYPKPNL